MEIATSVGMIGIYSGCAMIFIGIILIVVKNKRLKNWEEALGEVIDIKKRKRRVKFYQYTECAPIVKFNGNSEVVIGDDGIYIIEAAFPYKIGSKVNLRYNSTNNNKFYVIHEGLLQQMYLYELVLLLVGSTFGIMGLLFLFGVIH